MNFLASMPEDAVVLMFFNFDPFDRASLFDLEQLAEGTTILTENVLSVGIF